MEEKNTQFYAYGCLILWYLRIFSLFESAPDSHYRRQNVALSSDMEIPTLTDSKKWEQLTESQEKASKFKL